MSTRDNSLVTADLAISLDGFTAGPNQTLDKPFGDGEDGKLTRWMIETAEENAVEMDAIVASGAFIMGRNMFGPDRGEWNLDWTGWWGDDPPYHAPVFVLAHRQRETITLDGGTSFTFVTDGIESALSLAREAAGDESVAIAGGASTINQYLAADLIDELRLDVVPVTLGAGERLFDGVPPLQLEQISVREATLVTHNIYRVVHSRASRA